MNKYYIVSYYVGEEGDATVWEAKDFDDAVDQLEDLWKKSKAAAEQDETYAPGDTYCNETRAVVAWNDGLYRVFEVASLEQRGRGI